MNIFYSLRGLLLVLFFGLLIVSPATASPPGGYINIFKTNGEECLNSIVTYSLNSNCQSFSWDITGGVEIDRGPNNDPKVRRIQWNSTGLKSIEVSGVYPDASGAGQIITATPREFTITAPVQQQLTVTGTSYNATAAGTTICIGNSLSLTAPTGATECQWSTLRYVVSKNATGTTINITPQETTTYILTYKNGTTCAPAPITYTVTVAPLIPRPVVVGGSRLGPGTIRLTVSNAQPGATYTWSENNITYPTGASLELTNVSSDRLLVVEASPCQDGYGVEVPVKIYSVQIVDAANNVINTPVPMRAAGGLVLKALSTGTGTYQWQCNGLAIASATAQQHTVTQPGRYIVAFSDANGTAFSQEVEVIDGLAQQT